MIETLDGPSTPVQSTATLYKVHDPRTGATP